MPDFVINSGGAMNVCEEMQGYNRDKAMARAATIYDRVQELIEISKRDQISTNKAAERLAEERIAASSK